MRLGIGKEIYMHDVKIFKFFHDKGSFPEFTDDRTLVLCGAALERHRDGVDMSRCLRDDNGLFDFSKENGQYSELSGIFYIWDKIMEDYFNTDDIVAFEHYRRHIIDPETCKPVMKDSKVLQDISDIQFAKYSILEGDWTVYDFYKMCFHEYGDAIICCLRDYIMNVLEQPEDIIKETLAWNLLTRGNIMAGKVSCINQYLGSLYNMLCYCRERIRPDREDSRIWGYIAELWPWIYYITNATLDIRPHFTLDYCVIDPDPEKNWYSMSAPKTYKPVSNDKLEATFKTIMELKQPESTKEDTICIK